MNVRPGMNAVVVSSGCLVEVLEEVYFSHLLSSLFSEQVWPVRAISPGSLCVKLNMSVGLLGAGEEAFCADRFLRPLQYPDSQVTTTRQREVTA